MSKNIITKDNWQFKTKEGFYFKKGDVITDNLYLGKGDSIDNWEVITEAQKAEFEVKNADESKDTE